MRRAATHPCCRVIGGGIAGLAAAWHLRERDVLVLEASDRLGGRVRSEPRDPYCLNLGAHAWSGRGSATWRLAEAAGVELAPVPGELVAVELNGKIVAGGRTFADWLGPLPADAAALFRATVTRSTAEMDEIAFGHGVGYFVLVWSAGGGGRRDRARVPRRPRCDLPADARDRRGDRPAPPAADAAVRRAGPLGVAAGARAAVGRVHLAGDYLGGVYTETAIQTGESAAAAIRASLTRESA